MKFLQIPVDNAWVSQTFGGNRANYEQYDLQGHNGIDFACPEGTPVYLRIEGVSDDGTAANGIATCVFAGSMGLLGNVVIVHVNDTRIWKGGYLLLYAHLMSVQCVTGIGVANGWTIGLSGNTGRSTGPHLHFGLSPCAKFPNFKNTPPDWRSAQIDRNNGYLGWIDSLGYFDELPRLMPGASADFTIHDTQPQVEAIVPEPTSTPETQNSAPSGLKTAIEGKAKTAAKGIQYEGNRLVRRGLVVLTTLMIAWQTGAVNPDQIVGLLSSALVPLITGHTESVEMQLDTTLDQLEARLASVEARPLTQAQPVFEQPDPTPTPLPAPVPVIPDTTQCSDVIIAGGWNLREGPDKTYASRRVSLYPREQFCVSYPATHDGWYRVEEGIDEGLYIHPEAFERG